MRRLTCLLLLPLLLGAELTVTSDGEATYGTTYPAFDGEAVAVATDIACGASDATDLVTCVGEMIAAVAGGAEANERVLRAVARQVTTAGSESGVTSLVLPTDFADFEYLELIVFDPVPATPGNNTTATVRIETAWLALQTDADDAKVAVLDSDEAGSRQWLEWTPSTRTLARGVQSDTSTNQRIRISAARLFDGGGGGGGTGEIADNSILPIKAQSDTGERQRAWRERIASAHIGSGTTLPTAAVTNVGDVWIFPQDVLSGLSWRDISAVSTTITSADAGDVGLYLPRSGWVRVGNILAGAAARTQIATLQSTVQANTTGIATNHGLIGTNITALQTIDGEVEALEGPQGVTSRTGNYLMAVADLRRTLRHSGTANVTYSTPSTVDVGWEVVVVNDSSGTLNINFGTDIIDEASSMAPVATRDARRVQYVGSSRWVTIANTAVPDATGATDQTARDDAAGALTAATQARTDAAAAQTTADSALSRTQRLRPISQWELHDREHTILVEWKPVGAVSSGAALGVVVQGVNISGITSPEGIAVGDRQGVILSITVPGATSGSISASSNALSGHVEIQVTHGGVTDSTWMGTVKGGWRTLTGSSSYGVRRTDDEFMVLMRLGGVDFPLVAPRALLSTTARTLANQSNNPNQNNPDANLQWSGATFTLNAAGTSLTVAVAGDDTTGRGNHSIQQVLAR